MYNITLFLGKTSTDSLSKKYKLFYFWLIYKQVERKIEMNTLTDSQQKIIDKCDELKALLLEKNRKYGDSALNPVRICSKSDACEQILVRIDDKLNRIKNRQNDDDEDVFKDLAGYLILYLVARD